MYLHLPLNSALKRGGAARRRKQACSAERVTVVKLEWALGFVRVIINLLKYVQPGGERRWLCQTWH